SGSSRRPRLAVTLGDPRGIGPEVVAKAVALGPLDADLVFLGSEQTAPRSLLPEEAGRIAGQQVEEAVRLAREGKVDAIVTGAVRADDRAWAARLVGHRGAAAGRVRPHSPWGRVRPVRRRGRARARARRPNARRRRAAAGGHRVRTGAQG